MKTRLRSPQTVERTATGALAAEPAAGSGCVDLLKLYGKRFSLGWEADGKTRHLWPSADRAWLREIVCRYGRVYPVGGTRLGAFTEHRRIRQRLGRLPRMQSRGAEEVRFDVADAEAVFGVMRPHRRRQVSDAERQRLRRMGAATRFRPQHVVGGESSEPESTNARQRIPTGRLLVRRNVSLPRSHRQRHGRQGE